MPTLPNNNNGRRRPKASSPFGDGRPGTACSGRAGAQVEGLSRIGGRHKQIASLSTGLLGGLERGYRSHMKRERGPSRAPFLATGPGFAAVFVRRRPRAEPRRPGHSWLLPSGFACPVGLLASGKDGRLTPILARHGGLVCVLRKRARGCAPGRGLGQRTSAGVDVVETTRGEEPMANREPRPAPATAGLCLSRRYEAPWSGPLGLRPPTAR